MRQQADAQRVQAALSRDREEVGGPEASDLDARRGDEVPEGQKRQARGLPAGEMVVDDPAQEQWRRELEKRSRERASDREREVRAKGPEDRRHMTGGPHQTATSSRPASASCAR